MAIFTRPSRILAAILLFALVTGCAKEDLTKPLPAIGDFDLEYVVIVTRNTKQVGPSRPASGAEWEAVLKEEIEKRTGRYAGEKLYHLGIAVDGYALAVPGVPTVFSPKSILVLSLNVWDDSAKRKINAVPKQIVVMEGRSMQTFIGSGLTQNREQQMRNLAEGAAREIQKWLVENKAWFTPEAVAARAAGLAGTPGTLAEE